MRISGICILVFALAGTAAAQDPLAAARDLYASASYEEALAALATVAAGAPPDVAVQAHQYRAFSLFALGRTDEAEQVAEMSIRLNPLVRLNEAETSPRIASMFSQVRGRVLPAVIRDEYRSARAAIDRKDLKAAEPHLTLASRLITEAQAMGVADDTLSDLSLVIDGFLGLSRAAAQPRPQPVADPTSTPAVQSTGTTAAAPRPPSPAVAASPQIYSGPATSQLTPPVTVRQQSPELPRNIAELVKGAARRSLILTVLINEQGDVEDVSIVQPVQPTYDALVARAARQWKYEPATVAGVPVKYRKAITVDFVDR